MWYEQIALFQILQIKSPLGLQENKINLLCRKKRLEDDGEKNISNMEEWLLIRYLDDWASRQT